MLISVGFARIDKGQVFWKILVCWLEVAGQSQRMCIILMFVVV